MSLSLTHVLPGLGPTAGFELSADVSAHVDVTPTSTQSLPARRPSGPAAGRCRIALTGAIVTVEPSTVAVPSTSSV